MSADAYAVIRNSTISWLLERARVDGVGLLECPVEVARDLGEFLNLGRVEAPPEEERLTSMGPILSVREHVELLAGSDLDLPRDPQSSRFWNLVVEIVHAVLCNEAEAVRRIIGAEKGV